MKCKKCGKDIPEQINYCPTCKINESKKQTVDSGIKQMENVQNVSPIIKEESSETVVLKTKNGNVSNTKKFIYKIIGITLMLIPILYISYLIITALIDPGSPGAPFLIIFALIFTYILWQRFKYGKDKNIEKQ